jgi:hypothetical protein
MMIIIGAGAGGVLVVGLVIVVYCLYKRSLRLEESIANEGGSN